MNSIKRNSSIFLVLLFLYSGCNSNIYEEYYKKTGEDWEAYLEELASEEIDLQNTVVLILKSSECTPSIQELKWWNDYNQNNSNVNVQLIILEKYATTFETFLIHEELQIPALRDSAGILFRNNLLPTTPLKIYINEKGVLENIAVIGNEIDSKQDVFLNALPQ